MDEIETKLPRQARNAYLVNRLDQLTEELYRTYRDYQDVRRELSEAAPATELDERIRDTVENSVIPGRRARESRNLYMLTLLIALIVFNVGPLRLSSYFYVLGYSERSTSGSILTTVVLGIVCFSLAALVGFSFLPSNMRSRITGLGSKVMALTISLSVVLFILLLWAGFYYRSLAMFLSQFNDIYNAPTISAEETEAGLAFNFAVIVIAIVLAAFVYSRQGVRKQRPHRQRDRSDRMRNA